MNQSQLRVPERTGRAGWIASTDHFYIFGSTVAHANNSSPLPRHSVYQILCYESSPESEGMHKQVAAARWTSQKNREATHPISASICAHSALTVSRSSSLPARDSLIADKTPSGSTSFPRRSIRYFAGRRQCDRVGVGEG